jgi:hypothetical protein
MPAFQGHLSPSTRLLPLGWTRLKTDGIRSLTQSHVGELQHRMQASRILIYDCSASILYPVTLRITLGARLMSMICRPLLPFSLCHTLGVFLI